MVGCVSKGYTAPAPVPSPTGTASPLALFTLAAISSRTLNIAVTTTKGLGDAPITRHVALDVVTATLKVQVGCGWRNRKRLLLLLLLLQLLLLLFPCSHAPTLSHCCSSC